MRNSLWLLGLLLLLLPASAPRAAFISLENPVADQGMMTWDVVLNWSVDGDTLGSLDVQMVAFGPDLIDLTGTQFLKGSVLDDPDALVAISETLPLTVLISGFNTEGAETTTLEATAFGTLTVSWNEPPARWQHRLPHLKIYRRNRQYIRVY